MTDRITSTPGDVWNTALDTLIGLMDEDIRARHPGAYGPPDPMPEAEKAVEREMRHLVNYETTDHEGRARQWERIMELVSDAADYEWRQAGRAK